MNGKKAKALRQQAYKGKPTDMSNRGYDLVKQKKQITVRIKDEMGEIVDKVVNRLTLVCADARVTYKDLKQDARRQANGSKK